MKILVIDDSREHLEVMKDIFEGEGYSVVSCLDAFHALQLLSEGIFDCTILDLKMPILEGTHLLTIIHEKHPNLPVIILSGHIEKESKLTEKGAYAVVAKPPNITTLVATVENAIHESKNSVKFVFKHTNLRKIKDTVIARLVALSLKKCHGNQLKASTLLGISRQCLIRYMKKYKIAMQ